MARITIDVKDSKVAFVLELLKSLNYVKVEKPDGFDELSPEVKQEIDDSIAELDQGKSIQHEQLFKELRQDLRA